MSSDRSSISLADICTDVSYGYTESASNDPIGPKFLRITDIQGGTFDWNKVPFCPASDEDTRKYRLEIGDIVVARTGNSTGENAQLTATPPAAVFASYLIRFRPDSSRINPFFVGYQLRSERFRHHVLSVRGGSAQPGANAKQLGAFEIQLLPRALQDSTVETLRSIDDRITLLRETNATLEAIAQALFKSWFVDFDPVRAKQEGRAPEGMDEATATLFPDAFEESELGLAPRGWRVTSVSEVAEVVKGKSYSSKDLVEENHTALVTLKSFERGGGFRLDGFKPYTGSYKPSQVVKPGDLIIAYTDVTQAAELIGKPAIVVSVENHTTLVASLDVGIVRPDPALISRQFLYGLFRTESFQSHTYSHTSGTTVLHLAKDGVGSFDFSCPPIELVNAFSEVAESLAERRQTNIDQMRTLATLRDTLLPRLISGQLRLPEAEAQLESVLA